MMQNQWNNIIFDNFNILSTQNACSFNLNYNCTFIINNLLNDGLSQYAKNIILNLYYNNNGLNFNIGYLQVYEYNL